MTKEDSQDNKSVYESAKLLRDKYVLTLDNGKTVYLEFFSSDTDRNIYQVAHQITMDPAHKDDVSYKNRYDVTILINGLPLIQIELKRPGVEINEAINQINRYRKFSFRGLFRYLQLFVVSNSVQTKYFCNENEMENGMYNPILKSLVFFWTDDKNKRTSVQKVVMPPDLTISNIAFTAFVDTPLKVIVGSSEDAKTYALEHGVLYESIE